MIDKITFGESMQNALYVSLSGQIALARRMDTVANNVANMSTAGYRAENVHFRSVLANAGSQSLAYVAPSEISINRTQGSLSSTGSPWDVAVRGNGWLAVRTPTGVAYTRDGRFTISAGGQLQTVTGFPVLDPGQSPITLSTDGGPPKIGADGSISQGNQQAGSLGLFALGPKDQLSRGPSGTVFSSANGAPVTDFISTQIAQGFTEGSNSEPLTEMTELIRIQRAFELLSNSMEALESTKTDSIKVLSA